MDDGTGAPSSYQQDNRMKLTCEGGSHRWPAAVLAASSGAARSLSGCSADIAV